MAGQQTNSKSYKPGTKTAVRAPAGWKPLDDYDPAVSERVARRREHTSFGQCTCASPNCPDKDFV